MPIYDSGNTSEVKVVLWFAEVIQTEIDTCKTTALGYDLNTLTDEQKAVISFSRTQIIYEPDSIFKFVGVDEYNQEYSTPVILLEMDNRPNTQGSVQGRRIYGESNFTLTVIVGRTNRAWSVYKQEVVDIVNGLENIFKTQTDKRIKVGDITFADFKWDSIPVSGAVIPISTPINNYSYNI